jgi:hypothetical protein
MSERKRREDLWVKGNAKYGDITRYRNRLESELARIACLMYNDALAFASACSLEEGYRSQPSPFVVRVKV